jgi:ribosomal protein S12 methylthiotransferase
MTKRFWVETLGCPKNQVDSDKLTGRLLAGGLVPADTVDGADVVVVNTCAFIEEARQESIDTILALSDERAEGARLVVTGCLAERHGPELVEALPEIDEVAGFGRTFEGLAVERSTPLDPVGERTVGNAGTPVSVQLVRRPSSSRDPSVPEFDLLHLPRPPATAPWAYVKVAEGCDRVCGFCAIPSFRGPQRSRTVDDVLAEVDALGAREIVLVAQDLAAYGRDQGQGRRRLAELVQRVGERVDRVRCLYLYPSDLSASLVETICATGVPYFDLSLQHVSRPLLHRMRRWGDGDRFLARIDDIRRQAPDAAFRSNFIVGYPGETEADHDQLLAFVEAAQLDWCGFFAYSPEVGTYAAGLDGVVAPSLVAERLSELRELQDGITQRRRDALVGCAIQVLVDESGVARGHREAPEIDGVVLVPDELEVGAFHEVEVVAALGPDLEAVPVRSPAEVTR